MTSCFRIWLLVLLAALAGCGDSSRQTFDNLQKTSQEEQGPLSIVVVDDAELTKTLTRVWSARSENEIKIRQMSQQEFLAAKTWQADIVIYPPASIGTLADANRILPIPAGRLNKDNMGWVDIFPVTRLRMCTWNKKAYATPFGSRPRILLYRQDIFEKLKLEVPKTWGDLGKLAKRLSDRSEFAELAQGSQWQAVAEPLGKGDAGLTLLSRAASYATHSGQFSTIFDIRDMRPLINGAPFQRALRELMEVHSRIEINSIEINTPLDAFKALIDGKCAIAVCYPVSELTSIGYSEKTSVPSISAATLPGSNEIYNVRFKKWDTRDGAGSSIVPVFGSTGRIASVARESNKRRAAFDALALLSNREWSELIAPTSNQLTLFRKSHVFISNRWVDEKLKPMAKSYSKSVEETLSATSALSCLRIPGRERYLQALDRAVQKALARKGDPQTLLNGVASKWESVTRDLGVEKQRQAYGRSIGIESE